MWSVALDRQFAVIIIKLVFMARIFLGYDIVGFVKHYVWSKNPEANYIDRYIRAINYCKYRKKDNHIQAKHYEPMS